jgi:non-heme chloroperoxidase
MSGEVHDQNQFVQDLAANVSQFSKELQEARNRDASVPELHPPPTPIPPIIMAINLGDQKYEAVHAPVLAIFACPHNFDFIPALRDNPKAKADMVANDLVTTTSSWKGCDE